MRKFNIRLVSFIILSILVWNNQNIIFAQQLKTQHISIGEGLSNGSVNAIIQDKYGFLWIATDDGLNRYDGYEFKVYKNVPGNPNSLIDNRVWDIKEDKDGNLWIATYEGVSYFARLTNKFTNYEIDTLVVPRDSGRPLAVSVLIDSFDDVWIGTVGAGAIRLNKSSNKFQKVLLSSNQQNNTGLDVTYAMTENENTIFAGNLSSGLIYYDRDKGEFKNVEFKSESKLPDFKNFDENISKLYVDKNGMIWIVSVYGVYKFNPVTNEIFNVQTYKVKDIFSVWMLYTGLITDTDGNIWIGKDKRGLFKYDGISDEFSQIEFGTEYPNMPNTYSEIIRTMYRDNTGIIWIGTYGNGLFKFDPASEPFTQYKYDPVNEFSIGGNELFSLFESTVKPNTIYVGLRGAGLNIYNPENNRFSKVKLDFLKDVFGGSVRAILEENDGSLYLGTWGDGLFKYSSKSGAKLISRWDSLNNASLSNNLVRILKKDSDGLIWIGTADGLNVYDPVYDSVKRIYTPENVRLNQEIIDLIREKNSKKDRLESLLLVGDNEEKSKLFSIDRPRDYLVVSVGEGQPTSPNMFDFGWIETESGDTIWSAAKSENSYHLNGALKNRISVELLRLKPGQYKLNYKSDDSHSYGKWNADAPLDSTLWGIQIFNLSAKDVIDAGRYISESNSQPLVSGTNIRSIHMSKQNNNIIWIGTDAFGLDKYDKSTNKVTNFRYDPKNKNTVSNNSIQFILEDNNGILWLATNAGLNRFDPVKEEFEVYTEEDGLPTNYIASILEDDMGKLWLATRNGLSRMSFSEERATFVNYDSKDGLGGSDFIAQVALKGSNGKLYFGGEHGLNEFYPGKMNVAPPELIITDLKIGNKSVTLMGDDSPINTSIFDVKEITLPHDQNDLSFEFAALHYARAEKNQYAHILEGYDEDWSYLNRRFATYTNLDPGEYIFKFRGSNSDGIWNDEGKSIIINILPPWWLTVWAYIGYGLLFIGIIFGVDRFQRRRLLIKVNEKRKLEEAEIRAQTAELQAKATVAEKRAIEAEFNQKKKELDEARELQLSMLPRKLPQLPNLDIAVYMKTATEVGGDYYDFHVGLDGTLTVVLGDATGHGMKAGTMVTAAKTLFNSYAANSDILYTFHEMTRCIKQLQFHMLSMCLTMIKIQGNKITMSAAGMPPLFIYRRDDRTIEEQLIKGMPLGTIDKFPYDVRESYLNPGDTILMMSDGFPELMDEKNELLGYKQTRNIFEDIAEKSPEEIIEILKEKGSTWINGNDPDDDVTFVVIKRK